MDIDNLLALSEAVAADPRMQGIITEKWERFDWAATSIEMKSPGDEELALSSQSFPETLSFTEDEWRMSPQEENAVLRRENEALKRALAAKELPSTTADTKSDRPAVARIQALARGVLTRRERRLQSIAAAALPPLVVVRFEPHLSEEGEVCVIATIELVDLSPPKGDSHRSPKSQAAKEFPRQAMVVTAAIVIGVCPQSLTSSPALLSTA
jgi:hypothetical protein